MDRPPRPWRLQTEHWSIAEDVFIFLSIAALWPRILAWPGMIWDVLMYTALVGLVVIFVRRYRRIRDAASKGKDEGYPPR